MNNFIKTFSMELKNHNYALNTRKTYVRSVEKFIQFSETSPYPPEERIRVFLYECSDSYEQTRTAYHAIKLFYKLVLKKECPYSIDKAKRRKRLPGILNKEEILDIIAHIKNKKHYLMIALLYAGGLRVSEVVTLKVKDIDLSALTIHVRNSKFHKDRFTILSQKLKNDLADIIKGRKPEEYLFISLHNKKYSVRTVQQILEKAVSKTSINKKATCHTLRPAIPGETPFL